MEKKKYKCSLKEHNEIDAICYCQKCDIYMCNKCEKYHINIFPNHNSITLDKDISNIFTGYCKVENHINKLEYFCKTHNILCCAQCIIKIKRKGNGQHTDCNVCNYEDIIDEKKENLKNNIKILEDLSNSLQSSIDELKIIVEKLTKNKEEIKLNIQKIFTKIRNAINNREDELLLEVDNEFDKLYFNEEILTETEKLPNKIKISLEKGKTIDKEWNNNKLNSLINDCINIENDIKSINKINEKIKECKSTNKEIKFNSGNDEITILELIKKFGNINSKKENNNNDNINILDFNPQNIKFVKKITDSFDCSDSYEYNGICFFISKKDEYVLGYIDKSCKSIIFYDINNDKEIKKINNAHDQGIYTIRYYDYNLYDIILTSSYNNDIKIWNYNESLNILTINNIFNNYNYVFSSALLFDNNSFYIFCVGYTNNYINVYNSSGSLYKNIGNNDEDRRYIEIYEINENKYIISGGNKGINAFNYPSFSNYYCFRENNDTKYHNYAKIIKIKNIYNLIDVGNFNKIKIWDFFNKNLIKCITSNSENMLGGYILINNIYLIIGSLDKEIKVFDINNGIIVKNFNKHTSSVIGIKAIKDKNNNQYFVSYGQGDYTINLWSLN